ncbi:MAG: glycine/D-amino acid oxidase-like deaminating enzyme [Enterobacterales bacterium]|jgi:glycine/D-amino acid oxidase-like deaminating enzyme
METQTIICGAGIAGIATAYYLSVKYGKKNIVLIDRLLPLSLTTSKSGENYRDYWPQACMTEFTTHSLDLMDELIAGEDGNIFEMHEIGYDFISANNADIFPSSYNDNIDMSDYLQRLVDKDELKIQKPYLDDSISQVVNVKRAGVLDVNALGTLMLAKAKKADVIFKQALIEDIKQNKDDDYIVTIKDEQQGATEQLQCSELILAAGPFIAKLAQMLDIDLPVENYLQHKFIIPDPKGAVPRDMPFSIYADNQYLNWTDEEKDMIAQDEEYAHLLAEYPPGLHIKPEGRNQIKLGWAFNRTAEDPQWETTTKAEFADIVIRGASRFIPALKQYIDNMPTPIVHFSGYYTRTKENWPIIGPLQTKGLYIVGALSGYGTMSGCSAGELCADYMNDAELPSYAKYFHPNRYNNEEVMEEIAAISSDGQL